MYITGNNLSRRIGKNPGPWAGQEHALRDHIGTGGSDGWPVRFRTFGRSSDPHPLFRRRRNARSIDLPFFEIT